jgi:hypothetical protein
MLVAALTLAACGSAPSTSVPDAGGNADAGSPSDAGGGCDGVGREVPDEGAQHAPSEPDGGYFYASQPPASGNHYPTPAAWGVYTVPVARERYVHSEEHGGVVLLYNCPQGCPDVVAGFEQLFADTAPDPDFGEVKLVVTPDPLYDGGQVAAAAWDHVFTPDHFDSAGFRCFIDAYMGHGPEQVP